jgi:hypothetical protein
MIRMLFTLMLFFSLSEAQFLKNFSFVGISASTETVDIENENLTHKAGVGIRYGQQSQEWRTVFALEYHQTSYHSFSVEIDKILLDEMFGTPKLRPYLGGTAGYMNYDEDQLEMAYEESKGFYFGGNFGFIIYATDDIDVDLGYHYYKVQNLDFLDDLHGLTLAIHYFY